MCRHAQSFEPPFASTNQADLHLAGSDVCTQDLLRTSRVEVSSRFNLENMYRIIVKCKLSFPLQQLEPGLPAV